MGASHHHFVVGLLVGLHEDLLENTHILAHQPAEEVLERHTPPTAPHLARRHSFSVLEETSLFYDRSLGVPRNPRIPATADPAYFDLGLCGPDRIDLVNRTNLCGAFKVPTLRNVATRKVLFHNGAFTSLKDVVSFYVRRDTNPEEWYPRSADGSVLKFNDSPPPPPEYRANVNTTEVPYNRQPGMAPALTGNEIDDLVKFLGTLSDADQFHP